MTLESRTGGGRVVGGVGSRLSQGGGEGVGGVGSRVSQGVDRMVDFSPLIAVCGAGGALTRRAVRCGGAAAGGTMVRTVHYPSGRWKAGGGLPESAQ